MKPIDRPLSILITNHHLLDYTGSEVYTYFLSNELKKKGHQPIVYSRYIDKITNEFENSNIQITDNLHDIKHIAFDVAHVHHNINALEVRSAFNTLPIVYVCHGVLPFLEQPPIHDINISKYIAVSEEVRNNLITKNIHKSKIKLIRNIIDPDKFKEIRPINEKPQSILIISARIDDGRLEKIVNASKALNISVKIVGGRFGQHSQSSISEYIQDADIVFSLGRGAVEAIYSGRIPFIYDYLGGDGLITPDNYDESKQHNFSGRRYNKEFTTEQLIAELEKYNPNHAQILKTKATKDFSLSNNVNELIAIYKDLSSKNSSITEGQKVVTDYIVSSVNITRGYTQQYLSRKFERSINKINPQIFQNPLQYDQDKQYIYEVSIIIPIYNKCKLTKQCINSIYHYTQNVKFEIIVIDNGSTDNSHAILYEYIKKYDNLRIILNGKNYGYAAANNIGAKISNGKNLILLNNDTIVTKNWLPPLLDVLYNDSTIAAVGPKLLFADDTIQHAGVAIIKDPSSTTPVSAIHMHYKTTKDSNEVNSCMEYQALTAACLLIRKNAFMEVDGLDEKYWNGYEDVDLCLKMREKGYKLVYHPDSIVYHFESQSGPERFSRVNENILRLNHKWKDKIKPDFIRTESNNLKPISNVVIRPYQLPVNPNKYSHIKTNNDSCTYDVSIIILTFNQINFTKQCVKSIRKNTPENHEVIFIDNGSTDGTVKWLKRQARNNSHYSLITNKKNLGFSKGCNQGIEAATGTYILLLNNDVIVTPNWLSGLLECLNRNPDIGIVGPMTNNISGPQQVPVVTYEGLEGLSSYAAAFRCQNRHRIREYNRIVGFCMLFSKKLVDAIGGLDERFGTGNYEDDDFCLRALVHGYRIIIAGDVYIHHFGSRSFVGNQIDYSATMDNNRTVFQDKWSRVDLQSAEGKNLLAIDLLVEASQLQQKGDTDQCCHLLLKGIQQIPKDRRLVYQLAQILMDSQRYRDALDLLEALPSSDNDPQNVMLTGYCQEGLELLAEADVSAERICSVDSLKPQGMNLKGILAYRQGNLKESESFFRKAIAESPGYAEPYSNLGILACEAGRTEEAIAHYERSFILSPFRSDNSILYYNAIVETGEFKKASNIILEAKTLYPMNRQLTYFYIDILIKQNKYTDALDEIGKAITLFGFDKDILSAGQAIRDKISPKLKTLQHVNAAPSISVCMAMRNNENHLPQMLRALKSYDTEMIVIDAGSTDHSRAIANFFGAQIYDIENTNDISALRNFAAAKAVGDWIFYLDANEKITLGDLDKLIHLTQNGSKGIAYTFEIRHYVDPAQIDGGTPNCGDYPNDEMGSGWVEDRQIRLFHIDNLIHFTDAQKANQEAKFNALSIPVEDTGVVIHNYGKLPTATDHSQEAESIASQPRPAYQRSMSKDICNNVPVDIEIAARLYQRGEFDKAIEVSKSIICKRPNELRAYQIILNTLVEAGQTDKILSMVHSWELITDIAVPLLALIGSGYEAVGALSKAAKYSDQVLEIDQNCSEGWNLKGVLAYREGNIEAASSHFEKATQIDTRWGEPWTNMGTTYWEREAHDKALDCFEKGFSLSPTAPNVATTYHAAVSQTNQYDRAKPVFEDVVKRHPDFRKARFLLIDILIQLKAYPEALEHIAQVIVRFGADPQLVEAAKAVRSQVGPMAIKKRRRPSLSLCMIVKDEEKYLPRCLESLKPIVDEMIIVDTGSSDATREIAEIFGAHVFDFDWQDDFAAARNASLEKASGDWVIIMDADEVIAAKDHETLIALIQKSASNDKIAYTLKTRNYTDRADSADWIENKGEYAEEWSTGWVPSLKVRLFRNRQDIRFVFPVHEQVDPVLTDLGIALVECPVPVHHFGKLDPERTAQRWQLYYNIGKAKLDANINDGNALKELAIQAGLLSKWEEAATLWEEYLNRHPQSLEACLNMTRVMAECDKFVEANGYAEMAFNLADDRYEVIYNLSLSALQTGQAEMAVTTAGRLVDLFPGDLDSRLLLGIATMCGGDMSSGITQIRKLTNEMPNASLYARAVSVLFSVHAAGFDDWVNRIVAELSKIDSLQDIATNFTGLPSTETQTKSLPRSTGPLEKPLKLFEAACRAYEEEDYESAFAALSESITTHPDHWEAYALLVDVMIQAGQETAIPEQLHPLERRPDLPAMVLSLIGSGYEAAGEMPRAAEFAARALMQETGCSRAWNLKGVLAYRNGNTELAIDHFQKAAQGDTKWGEPWTNLATVYWERQDHDMALDCFEKGFALSPTAPNVATTYHAAVSAAGCYKRAQALFENAVKRHPGFRRARFLLIDILICVEAYQAALDHIATILVRFGPDPALLEAAQAVRHKLGPIGPKKGKRPTLSLCMIVKNEEAYLARCLESLKPLVDEMIIVDTGSTDATRAIAEIFGARVFDYKWHDDFSAARNYSLEKASGDWILVMDADEVIATRDHKKIRNLLKRTKSNHKAFKIVTRNYTNLYNTIGWEPNKGEYPEDEEGPGWVPSDKVRIFPNNKAIRFNYPIHEVVSLSLSKLGIPVKLCPCPVHHYGKLNQKRERKKDERYFKLGIKKLSTHQTDPVAIREMAIQATKFGKYQFAIELWQRLIEFHPNNAHCYINLASNYCKRKQYQDAKDAALKAVKLDPDLKEGHLNLGLSELHLSNARQAAKIFSRIAKKYPNHQSVIFLLGSSQLCLGRTEEGIKTIQSFEHGHLWQNLSSAIQDLVESLMAAGCLDSARNLIAGSELLNCSNDKIRAYGRQLNMEAA